MRSGENPVIETNEMQTDDVLAFSPSSVLTLSMAGTSSKALDEDILTVQLGQSPAAKQEGGVQALILFTSIWV